MKVLIMLAVIIAISGCGFDDAAKAREQSRRDLAERLRRQAELTAETAHSSEAIRSFSFDTPRRRMKTRSY